MPADGSVLGFESAGDVNLVNSRLSALLDQTYSIDAILLVVNNHAIQTSVIS